MMLKNTRFLECKVLKIHRSVFIGTPGIVVIIIWAYLLFSMNNYMHFNRLRLNFTSLPNDSHVTSDVRIRN